MKMLKPSRSKSTPKMHDDSTAFLQRATETLNRLQDALIDADFDVENDGSALTITLEEQKTALGDNP